MKPPFEITPNITLLIAKISRLIGNYEAILAPVPNITLRKKNRIKTIKSTLAIEGNTLNEEQITVIFDGKKILGKPKEILEVKNALNLYDNIDKFKSTSIKSFKSAHKMLMEDLVNSAGNFRSTNVGILQGSKVKHVAPKAIMVTRLMTDLFEWNKNSKDIHPLIKSCVLHYEIEFIHPFEDGNGRMGRFWQTLHLSEFEEIFKYLPIESLIEKRQNEYYNILEKCDKNGVSTYFIEFMLTLILESLNEFVSSISSVKQDFNSRINKALDHFKDNAFSKKDYSLLFKNISSPTASRDLKNAVENHILISLGNKNQTKYKFKLVN